VLRKAWLARTHGTRRREASRDDAELALAAALMGVVILLATIFVPSVV
jgi:hypothetical protein